MNYFKGDQLPSRVLMALLFAGIFSVIAEFIPNVYFRYFDKMAYYSIEQPISVDKKFYNPCEVTRATIKRVSLINTTASSVIDLVLVKADKSEEKIINLNRDMAIIKGERVLTVHWPLPCDIPEGKYYWQAVMKYNVNGIERTYSYISETFNVVNKPIMDSVGE